MQLMDMPCIPWRLCSALGNRHDQRMINTGKWKMNDKTIAVFFLMVSLVSGGEVYAGCDLLFDPMLGMNVRMGHPCAQPHPGPSSQVLSPDGATTYVVTPEGMNPVQDPFLEPPGSNFLMTVYENLRDLSGREMPNTLPSTPQNTYNLHDGPVLKTPIPAANPEEDLEDIIAALRHAAKKGRVDEDMVQLGIDILEGNPIPYRAYSGFPMLHYNGPNKVKRVMPIYDESGKVVGGNVDVNLIYFGQHIEGDTAFVDPSAVQEVPWTITYHVNILNRGREDFSPMVMLFNRFLDPRTGEDKRGPFHAAMDQSFFPMLEEGMRYTIKIKETKGKHYNLTYIWGWRIHPPRVQVIENALKTAGPDGWTLPQWEKAAFCRGGANDPACDPMGDAEDKRYAISQIGDLSPAKRMWNILRSLKGIAVCDDRDCEGYDHHRKHSKGKDGKKHRKKDRHADRHEAHEDEWQGTDIDAQALLQAIDDLQDAFHDWRDRTKLPSGVEPDPDATMTLFYVNNTIYGSKQGMSGTGSKLGAASYKGINNGSVLDWHTRPYRYKVTLLNGDHFPHGYMNVDFGGSRGWENHFQYSDPSSAIALEAHPETPSPFSDPGVTIAGDEHIFPVNRGGIEEFLRSTPRNRHDPVNGQPLLGSGCFFTFGRHHAWPNAGGPWGGIMVMPVAADGTPGRHHVEITFNYEPSPRLRMYQFDPLHHDVAVYSLH